MYLTNKRVFPEIIKLFKLEDVVQYFLAYNKSKYMWSYHGYEHMKNGVCSIFRVCSELDIPYLTTRPLVLAYIFHDFNYVEGTKIETVYDVQICTNPDYDEININKAIEAFSEFDKLNIIQTDYEQFCNIINLIKATQWPVKEPREDWSQIKTIMLECDHSMVLYDNYIPLVLQLSLNELKCTDTKTMIDEGVKWIENIQFNLTPLKELWTDELKQETIDKLSKTFASLIVTTSTEGAQARLSKVYDYENMVDFDKDKNGIYKIPMVHVPSGTTTPYIPFEESSWFTNSRVKVVGEL